MSDDHNAARAPVLSEKYPPVGQALTGVPPGHYRVGRDEACSLVFDRSIGVQRAYRGANGFVRLSNEAVDSELSGARGFYLQTAWVTLALTPEETARFFLRRLTPDEYFKLVHNHGVFFDIRDRFYDEETGDFLRPIYADDSEHPHDAMGAYSARSLPADAEERQNILNLARGHLPHALVLNDDFGPRVHSIIRLSQANLLVQALTSAKMPEPKVIPLTAPGGDAVALRAFDNLVTLISFEDGTLGAFGPFAGPEQLVAFSPAKAKSTLIRVQRSDLANSSAVAAQLS